MNRLTKEEVLKKLLEIRNATEGQVALADKLKKLAQPKNEQTVFNEISAENPTLGAIAMTESSGGTNYNHALDAKSNTHAGGMFGMMPSTTKDVLKLNPDLAKQYPELQDAALNGAPDALSDRFNSDPEAAADFAKAHYARNNAKLGGDEDATSFSWFNGLNSALRARRKGGDAFQKSPYVKKVLSFKEPLDSEGPDLQVANLDDYIKGLK